ncbi:MAG: hypothetical protein HRT72_12555 [Flavobacteriales bacterium]|nr:hypothetical protein [Flavobacteriales bacterium]
MKKAIFVLFLLFSAAIVSQAGEENTVEVKDEIVEVSCGQCQFGLEGSGCSLAVKVNGTAYYADGSSMDDHGDAHGVDGMCSTIRKAKVTGSVKKDRFQIADIELLDTEE